jgi:hypothetical protein
MPEAVILDPYRPYAAMLIETLYSRHGIRTVCLHQRWPPRLRMESSMPVLRSPAVAAHYMVPDADWAQIARGLASRYTIVGVLPHQEGMVAPLATLAEHLGLSWAQPEVHRALRNKCALKSLIRRTDPSLRLNFFVEVGSAEEVLDVVNDHQLERYVLKPNDGSGNDNVAFFDQSTDLMTLRRYFAGNHRRTLLEEFISGPEFWVNGQTDKSGEPTVVGIGEYYRTSHNGVENLEVGGMSVGPLDPRFEPLRDYATRVMRALGLRRSPFHLEAIVDDRGPCLVEVGGRLCGELGTLIDMAHHGPQLDLIDVAAHYYVCDTPLGRLALDWDRVATRWMGSATGDSTYSQRLVRVDGADELERSPHFLFWIKEPMPGDFVHRTKSLTTRAWATAITGSPQDDPREVIEWTRHTVQLRGTADRGWNQREKWPMYAGLARKVGTSVPRPYEMRALFDRLD